MKKSGQHMPDREDQLAQRQKIVEAAIDLYVDDRANFTTANLAKKTRIKKVEILRLFPSRGAILKYFYPLCVMRYRVMAAEIEGYVDWPVEEKLANFAYAMFDLLQEQREFVEEHFVEEIFRASGTSSFQREAESLFAEILAGTCASEHLAAFFAKEYMHVVRFWIADDSIDSERTTALVDKIAAFVGQAMRSNELFYTGGDLLKYLIANNVIKVPFGKSFITRAMGWMR